MRKLSSLFLLALMLCFLLAAPVSAAQPGSLLLSKVAAPVQVFYVADKAGIPTKDFAGSVETLTPKDMTRDMAKTLHTHAKEKTLSGMTAEPTENKEVFFSGLEQGWYLVCSMSDKAEFAPFLICVPMTIGEKNVYDIQAVPKVDSPVSPSGPSIPITPEPNIPQTGAILWPQYLLLGLGAVAILAGLVEVYRGREQQYE